MPPIRPNLVALLHRCHPQVYRIALALCADRDDAERVVEQVITRSGPISGRWETEAEALRWFLHYTVLRSRDCPPCLPAAAEKDSLLNAATSAESAAIIAAIRQLPMQQREAFLLHHGEQLEFRQLATAMDCSSAAAANHLVCAVGTLKQLNSGELDDFTNQLPAMMKQLVPADEILEFQIQRMLARQRKWIWTRRVLRAMGWMILAVVVVWVAWTVGRMIHSQMG